MEQFSLHLLLAEDNKVARKIIKKMIRKELPGATMDEVETTHGVMEHLASETEYDAVLLDLSLKDDKETCAITINETMTTIITMLQIPVILISASEAPMFELQARFGYEYVHILGKKANAKKYHKVFSRVFRKEYIKKYLADNSRQNIHSA